ncbi:Fucose permease [Ferrithrix thermotolerans DSM 19514]|uniref:Fucose permease n=1 Tax=Ferrithrix thermotolerans DSM 19514 TaxID=1121881 RepID=A0A1M4XAN5_9ACTN|nr:Fucose permease [Ferrithrix thermotolerans DSM 19514]
MRLREALDGPLLSVLLVTGLFRASQNAAQTTLSLIGHEVLHYSPSLIGASATVVGLTSAIASIAIAGRLRPYQLKSGVISSLLLGAVSILLFYLASNLGEFLIASVLLGISGGLAMPTLATLSTTSRRISPARGVAAYTASLSASLALGPFYETFLLKSTHENSQLALLAFIPMPVVGVVLLASFYRGVAEKRSGARAKVGALKIRESAPIRLAISAQLLYQAPFVAVVAFGALLAKYSFGTSSSTAQLGFTVFFVFSFSSRIVLLWKPDVLSPTTLLKTSSMLTIVGVVMLATTHGVALFMISMAILGIPHGVTYPVSLALLAKWTSPETRTRANAALSSVTSFVGVLLPLVLGLIAARFGYQTMIMVVLLPVLTLSVTVLRSSEEKLSRQVVQPN